MTHLGELAPATDMDPAALEHERDTFDWYGETFAVADRLSSVVVLRMAWQSREADKLRRRGDTDRKRARTDEARDAADALTAQADRDDMAAMWEFLTGVLAPGEWDGFVEVTTLACASDEALGGLIQRLIGVITDRPTRRPSASPDGLSTNTPTSRGASPALTEKDLQDAELFFADSKR